MSPIIEMLPMSMQTGLNTDEKLDALYKALECDLVEVVYITIAGRPYTIFCDEEAKLRRWIPTLPLYRDGKCDDVIANNFVVTKEDDDENLLPLEPEEFKAIIKYLQEEIPKAIEEVRKVVAVK